MREKLILLSSFLGDPTVGVRRTKRQSQSPQRELCVGTKIGEFDKLQEVGVSLLLGLILVLEPLKLFGCLGSEWSCISVPEKGS